MMTTVDTTYTDFLAHALLRMPNGSALQQTVTELHAFLMNSGIAGYTAMRNSLKGHVYHFLLKDAKAVIAENEDAELSRRLGIIDRFNALWSDLTDCALCAGVATTEERLLITQWMELLRTAKTEEEISAHMESLKAVLLRQDKSLLVSGKWQVEDHLARFLAERLEEHSRNRGSFSREITLFYLLDEMQAVDEELDLVSCFQGELFTLTPANIYKLEGGCGEGFLRQELGRLEGVLSLQEFLEFLDTLGNEEYSEDDAMMASGVLVDLRKGYMARLA